MGGLPGAKNQSYRCLHLLKEKVISNLSAYNFYGKKCFENIHLSFLPGVKIGVVGINGAGKSSLMKIIAGLDKDFTGDAWAARDISIGYLPQEPKLDKQKTVRENIIEGVSEKKSLLEKFNSIALKLGEDYSEDLMQEMTILQDQIDSEDLWDLDSKIDVAMEALRCPADHAAISELSGFSICIGYFAHFLARCIIICITSCIDL